MSTYLAWPITFASPIQNTEAHVTLKYFGDKPVSVMDLTKRFQGKDLRLVITNSASWYADRFYPSTSVMVIKWLDMPTLQALRDTLADIRKDDFGGWKPHISLGMGTILTIAHHKLTPRQAIASVGPLTLYRDSRPICFFTSVGNGVEVTSQ